MGGKGDEKKMPCESTKKKQNLNKNYFYLFPSYKPRHGKGPETMLLLARRQVAEQRLLPLSTVAWHAGFRAGGIGVRHPHFLVGAHHAHKLHMEDGEEAHGGVVTQGVLVEEEAGVLHRLHLVVLAEVPGRGDAVVHLDLHNSDTRPILADKEVGLQAVKCREGGVGAAYDFVCCRYGLPEHLLNRGMVVLVLAQLL